MDAERTKANVLRLENALDDLIATIESYAKLAKAAKSARSAERLASALTRLRSTLRGVLEVRATLEAQLPKALPPRISCVVPIASGE